MVKNLPIDEISEQTVLGIALMDQKSASNIVVSLDEDDFYAANFKNRIIFRAMRIIYDAGKPIDITTVISQLETMKESDSVGGVDYLMQLAMRATSFSNVDFYIKNLQDNTLLRKLLLEIGKIENDYESKEITDINSFVAECESRVNSITEHRRVSDFVSIKESARVVGEKIQTSHGSSDSITGLPTGYSHLDTLINGLGKNELVILAARPAVGKSAFALNIAYNAASKTNRPVAIFSLEMSNEQILKRFFAMRSGIYSDNIQKGILSRDERLKLKETENELADVPIYIDDSSSSSIDDIVLKSRKLKEAKGDIALIVVDYIGLINDPKNIFKDNEQAKIASFSRRLKVIAGELQCPVLCLAQLNRQTESRDNHKPQLSDLRSSGAIEQDADKVMFLYRPQYYKDQGINIGGKKNANEEDQQVQSNPNQADVVEVLVAKARSGKVGTVELFFNKNYGKFFSPSSNESYQKLKQYTNQGPSSSIDDD